MRAIAILAAIAMVAGLFLPWLNPGLVRFVPWDLVKELEPSLDTLQKLASDAPELLAFLAGGGAVAMVAYALLRLRDQAAALGLPLPSADTLGDFARRLPEVAGTGAMAWAGGGAVLLLAALVGFPSRR